jgi:ribonuclease P protein component
VRADGRRQRVGVLEARIAARSDPADATASRVGLVVPRYKHTAVDRNRLKRRLRELIRLELLPMLAELPAPVDLVIRVVPPAYARDFDALRRQVRALGHRVREHPVHPVPEPPPRDDPAAGDAVAEAP